MTLTLTNYPFRDRWNDRQVRQATYTGPASYTTGGEAISNQNDFGWGRTHSLYGIAHNGSGAFRLLVLNRASQLVIWAIPNTGAEVANGVDLSTFTAEILATGT
jgi:hypothetical protein